MKYIIILCLISLTTLMSCQKEEAIVQQQEVKFSLAIPAAANRGGRSTATEVKSVVVTITDSEGNSISEREKIALYAFGDNYLSAPITLKTTGASQYQLTEFMVTDANDQVLFATPIEGSNLAHLVTDPLAIGFTVSKDQITTVTPEVLAVNEDSTPEEFGYGQFGFSIIETIQAIFIASIKNDINNFEITNANLVVEGLSVNSGDTVILWSIQKYLQDTPNQIKLKKADAYRFKVEKEDYYVKYVVKPLSNLETVNFLLNRKMVYLQAIDIETQHSYLSEGSPLVGHFNIWVSILDKVTDNFVASSISRPNSSGIEKLYFPVGTKLEINRSYKILFHVVPINPNPITSTLFWDGSRSDSYSHGSSNYTGDGFFAVYFQNEEYNQINLKSGYSGTDYVWYPAESLNQEFTVIKSID